MTETHPTIFEATERRLRAIIESTVDRDLRYYHSSIRWPRFAAQLVTSLIIILSASLPFLAAATYPEKAVVVSGVSVAIALLTGLSAYWRWTDEWRGYVLAEAALTSLRAKWEVAMVNASLLPDAEASKAAVAATDALLKSASESVRRETTDHFASLLTSVDTTQPGGAATADG
jgi:hypothetical protein